VAGRDRLQPGEPAASASATPENRQLALHQSPAALRQDAGTADQAREMLLAPTGGEPSGAAAVGGHAAGDLGAAGTGWIGDGC